MDESTGCYILNTSGLNAPGTYWEYSGDWYTIYNKDDKILYQTRMTEHGALL